METQDPDSQPPIDREQAPTAEELPWAVAKVVNKASWVIGTCEQDFIAAGVTKEQLEVVTANIRRRALAEHEEREKQDPLRRIKEALTESAQTEAEHFLAEMCGYFLLEGSRKNLIEIARDPRRNLQGRNNGEWRGGLVWNVVIPAIDKILNAEGECIEPSRAFLGRFLGKLGVLEEGSESALALNDLLIRSYPELDSRAGSDEHSKTGPFREKDLTGKEWITRIPTDIDGVDARIPLSGSGINVSITPQALQKIQPPQP